MLVYFSIMIDYQIRKNASKPWNF